MAPLSKLSGGPSASKRPLLAEGFALDFGELLDAGFGELEEDGEFVVGERGFFAGALDFDEPPAASHDDIHIDVGCDVLRIVEIERGLAIDDAGADRGDAIGKWEFRGVR